MHDRTWTRAAARGVGAALMTLALATLAAAPGCGGGSGHPEGASPVVQPDSEAGRKAIAESKELHRLRSEQEAKARKRSRRLPAAG